MCIATWFGAWAPVAAQCPITINTFPYLEDFEAAPAWNSGGSGNDWAWGTPTKPVISGAASGDRCWVIGGLTNSFYIDSQQSWLEGPCFNMSGLTDPWVSFSILWECERDYDGLAFQYSLNAGATWTNVGAFGAAGHCLSTNWYNTQYISNLTLADPRHGWSGRVGSTVGICAGGQGSGTWVTASQCLPFLAGQPSVKFRFVFGAGSTCNSYDGVAIDDVFVGEAPPNQASFTYGCDGNTVQFTNTSALCPTGYLWNFGDPASGASNTSTLASPQHTYPGPGTYPVSLTVNGPCNAPSTSTQQITILSIDFIVSEASCAGGDGSIIAIVGGTSAPLDIVWSPGGQTSAVITGQEAGIYGITVNAAGACPLQASVELPQQGGTVELSLEGSDITCNGFADGAITGTISGGAGGWIYDWEPPLGDGLDHPGLSPGTYTLTVTDSDGCSGSAQVTITEPAPLTIAAPPDTVLCIGASLLLQPVVAGGTPPYTIGSEPAGPLVMPEVNTMYTMEVTDANGCTAGPQQTMVEVSGPDQPLITVDPASGCVPHCITLNASVPQQVTHAWDLGDGGSAVGATPVHCYEQPGVFTVSLVVTDAAGCVNSAVLIEPVEAFATPVAVAVADPPITTIGHPTVLFTSLSAGAVEWSWSIEDQGIDMDAPTVEHTFGDVDCHPVNLLVTNAEGCTDEWEGIYCVEDDFALWAPNAFTPDGDGVNDLFGMVSTVRAPDFFELVVIDRWGSLLFATNDHTLGWDGMAGGMQVPQGVYLWQVRIHDVFGRLHERAGHVTLIR